MVGLLISNDPDSLKREDYNKLANVLKVTVGSDGAKASCVNFVEDNLGRPYLLSARRVAEPEIFVLLAAIANLVFDEDEPFTDVEELREFIVTSGAESSGLFGTHKPSGRDDCFKKVWSHMYHTRGDHSTDLMDCLSDGQFSQPTDLSSKVLQCYWMLPDARSVESRSVVVDNELLAGRTVEALGAETRPEPQVQMSNKKRRSDAVGASGSKKNTQLGNREGSAVGLTQLFGSPGFSLPATQRSPPHVSVDPLDQLTREDDDLSLFDDFENAVGDGDVTMNSQSSNTGKQNGAGLVSGGAANLGSGNGFGSRSGSGSGFTGVTGFGSSFGSGSGAGQGAGSQAKPFTLQDLSRLASLSSSSHTGGPSVSGLSRADLLHLAFREHHLL
jgi:hypothetical protein